MQREIRILKQGIFSPRIVLTCQVYLTAVQVQTAAPRVQLFKMNFMFLVLPN